MGKLMHKTICFLISVSMVMTCLNLFSVKQLAFAGEEEVGGCVSSSEINQINAYTDTIDVDSLYACKSASNDMWDIKLPFKNPINMMLKGFYKVTLCDKYDQISKSIYKSIFNFIHSKEPNPYKEAKTTLETIDTNLNVLQAEMTKVFNSYTLSVKMDSIKEQINKVSADLKGAQGEGGYLSKMNFTLDKHKKNEQKIKESTNPEDWRTYSNTLKEAANIYDYKIDTINNALYIDFRNLWSLVCDDCSEGSMQELYRACLKSEANPEYARNMFDRLYCTFLCNLLTINELMDYANAARIEQLDFVSNDPKHWDAITAGTGGMFESNMTKSYVLSLIHEDNNKDNEGLYINRARVIQEERKAIIEKMSEILALEDSTPSIVVSYGSQNKMFHSMGDAWACAMENNNSLVSLQSDVLMFRKKGEKDFYGRKLEKDEDMTTAIITRKDKKNSKCFKNGNLQVPYKVDVTLALNGHNLGNANSSEAVLNIEGYSKVTVDGGKPTNDGDLTGILGQIDGKKPVNDGDSTGNSGQIDGIYGGNKVEINVLNTEFNNVIKFGTYQLEEKKKENNNRNIAYSDTVKDSSNIRAVEFVVNKFSKPINQSLLNVKVDNTSYGKASQVNVEKCVFAMDDTAVLGTNAAGAIRMESDCTESVKTELFVSDSIFENCVSKKGNGGAIYLPGNVDVKNSKFINCTAEDGNGGAIYVCGKTKIDECLFQDCESKKCDGGAICQNDINNYPVKDYKKQNLDVSNSNFINDKSNNGNGGAICSCVKTQITKCNFDNCRAVKAMDKTTQYDGGAVYHDSSLTKLMESPTDLIMNTTLEIYSSNFSSNEAKNGGAIYSNGCLYVNGANNFTNNKAMDNGAVISNKRCTWEDLETFLPITYVDGCVIFNSQEKECCKFEGNTAGQDGGAISTDAYIGITGLGKMEMKNNKAGNNGGAIHSYKTSYKKDKTYKYHPSLKFDSCLVSFEGNSAKCGGAIWSQRDVESKALSACNNSASKFGAIFMDKDSTLSLYGSNSISNNFAFESCGGVSGKLSVAGHVVVSENMIKSQSGNEDQVSNVVIPQGGLYLKDIIDSSSSLHIDVDSNKNFRLTDDKSNESEKGKSKTSWKNRLDQSRQLISIDRSGQESKTPSTKTGKHGLRHVYWLEG